MSDPRRTYRRAQERLGATVEAWRFGGSHGS